MPNTYESLERLLLDEQAILKRAYLSRNSETGYSYDWKLFTAWCGRMQLQAFPADTKTVALYLTDQLQDGKKISTATRRTSAIGHVHRQAGFENPVTRDIHRLLKGAQRIRGEQPRQMRPLLVPQLRAIVEELGRIGTPLAVRNRAILVVGFASALRRTSLCDLQVEDVAFCPQGIVLTIRREKQDQEGRGRHIGIPTGAPDSVTCPVRTLQAWMAIRGLDPGPLFTRVEGCDRHAHGIRGEALGRMVKASVRLIGLDPSDYCGHSLRAGFVTAAGEAGATDLLIATQTGHHSLSVLRKYFRHADVWKSNACAAIGL